MAATSSAKPPRVPHPAATTAPPGTFAPGTKVQVGSHRVVVERYLSEGGFAHVYVVRLPSPDNAQAVLKRVAVPDKDSLASMRTEVDTMKKLKGHTHIVSYLDSHASQLQGGGYEVFLLMEFCQGGGLIDFMNTRLKNRLTEPEILEIFQDAAEGIACMHYLKPPLLHRDLKIENILISTSPIRMYKLCDFGSSAPPRPAPANAAEGRLIEEDIQKNTTLQYRSPEMIDVYRKRPIDEKSDIWALGVFLYKLCYYTTPFEEQGQMAILTASYKFPGYPAFSDRLKRLIALMLMEDPARRPNIYQVLKEVCTMRGKSVPVKDIYADRTRSEARKTQELPQRDVHVKSPPLVGATISVPEDKPQYVPDVTPMRRGRPTGPTQTAAKPSPSPAKKPAGDPFAALDSKNYEERVKAVNDLSGKFPSLDDFSLLQDRSSKFQFDSKKPSPSPDPSSHLNQRVTNALADDAFAKPSPPKTEDSLSERPPPKPARPEAVKPPKLLPTQATEAPEKPPKPAMVSVGTMTSPQASPIEKKAPIPEVKPKIGDRPVWRVPQVDEASPRLGTLERFETLEHKRHSMLREFSRSPHPEADTASSRPSLESGRPAATGEMSDIHRSRSANARQAPSRSGTPPVDIPSKRESFFRRHSHRHSKHLSPEAGEPSLMNEPNIESNIDFLRAQEEEAASRSSHHRSSSLHRAKHGSLGHLAGKVGDTLRRFDGNRVSSRSQRPESFVADADADYVAHTSATVPADATVDDEPIDVTEDLSPEMRRELERRQLEQEERRVEEAAQAYRQRVAANGTGQGGPNRASAIQSRVKNLLDESGRESPVKRTAEGYGRYTPTSLPQDAAAQPIRAQATDSLPLRNSSSIRPNSAVPDVPVVSIDSLPQRSSSIAVGRIRKPVVAPPVPRIQTEKALPPRPAVKPAVLRTPTLDQPATMQQAASAAAPDDADWETDFSKRYPRLSLDMVDADITGGGAAEEEPIGRKSVGGRPMRVRDV